MSKTTDKARGFPTMKLVIVAMIALFITLSASAHTRCANGSHWVEGHYYVKDGQSVWAKGRCVRN